MLTAWTKHLQSRTKVLGQICTFGALEHTPEANTTSLVEYNFTCLTSPSIPHTMLKTAPAISSDFKHCIGWEEGTVSRF